MVWIFSLLAELVDAQAAVRRTTDASASRCLWQRAEDMGNLQWVDEIPSGGTIAPVPG
jgi:hypothetical protein